MGDQRPAADEKQVGGLQSAYKPSHNATPCEDSGTKETDHRSRCCSAVTTGFEGWREEGREPEDDTAFE
jgi:hypothetical protein